MTDASGHEAAVNARLAELVRKFVARSEDEVAQMRVGLARFDAGDPAGLAQIHQLAHRACGTGGTLGLLALADAAAALEELTEVVPADARQSDSKRAQIAAGIDRFAAQLALI